jgi:hypothetical protein
MKSPSKFNDLAAEIEASAVPVDGNGFWTRSNQAYARKVNARFVGVSREQFYAGISRTDAVTTARTDRETKGSGTCSHFCTRDRSELGRIYSDPIGVSLYFLEIGFAGRKTQELEAISAQTNEQEPSPDHHQVPRG